MLTTRTSSRSLPVVLCAVLLVWGGPACADPTNPTNPTADPPPPDVTIIPPDDGGTKKDAWDGDYLVDAPGSGGSGPTSATANNSCEKPFDVQGLRYSCEQKCWYDDYGTQPSPGNPVNGHTDGKYYECKFRTILLTVPAVRTRLVPVFEDPWWVGPGGVDPAVLAQQAVASMSLRVAEIGTTGGSPPDGMQIVGIPAWFWAADPGESTTPGVAGVAPITRSASAGGITVTATARLDRTVWSVGDGATVTCAGANAAGTPWRYGYGGQPSPTCGYTYTRTSAGQPNEAYTVTATAYWVVDWSGGGQSGTLTVQRSRSIPKRVGEVQVIVVPNPGGR